MVVVLFVVITVVVIVVLAAVLFVLFAGLLGPPRDVPPVVHFGPVTYENQTAVLNVFSVSRAEAFTLYEANLFVNSTVGVPQQVSPSFQLSVGNESFTVDFVDAVRPGTLDPGDSFRIAALTGWRTGVEYQFELLWTNESPVAFVRWTR